MNLFLLLLTAAIITASLAGLVHLIVKWKVAKEERLYEKSLK